MKIYALALSLAALTSFSAKADLKPEGTVVEDLCGETSTFPRAVRVCLASVIDSDDTYLVVSSYNSEMPRGGNLNANTQYLKVHSIKNMGSSIVYEAQGVTEGSRPQVFTYRLTVQYNSNGSAVGTLEYNDNVIFGAEAIDMQLMYHTQSTDV